MFLNLALSDFVLLALRLLIAVVFFVHGSRKLRNWTGIPPFMRFIGTCEVLGSISMLSGFLVQISAIGLAIIMLGAMHKKIFVWKVAFFAEKGTGWEYDLTLFVILASLVIFGAGVYSVDSLVGLLIFV